MIRLIPCLTDNYNFDDKPVPEAAFEAMKAGPGEPRSQLSETPKLSCASARSSALSTCRSDVRQEQHLSSNGNPFSRLQTYRTLKEIKKGN